jgi:cobalt-zinc-cadmium efflux system outer membrane protein
MRRTTTLRASAAALAVFASTALAHAEENPGAIPIAAGIPAGTSEPALGLDEVMKSIDLRHPLIVSALKDKDAAKGDLLAAKGGFDPVWRTRASTIPIGYYDSGRLDSLLLQPTALGGVSLFAGYRIGFGKFATYDGKAETMNVGEARVGVTVPLWRDSLIDSRRAALWSAELSPVVAEAALAATKLELARAASIRYWNWVEAGRARQVARDLLGLAETRDAALADRVAKGDIAEIERQDNLRTILARKGNLISVERQWTNAAIELSLFLRDDKGSPLIPHEGQLPLAFPEPSAPTVGSPEAEVQKAIGKRPELVRFAAQKAQVEIEATLAKNGTKPALDFQTVVSKDFGKGPDPLRPVDVELGLVIDIPLLARTASGKFDTATAKGEKIEAQKKFLEDRIAADVKDALAAETAARARVTLARQELALAQKLAQAERDAFTLGTSTILLVNLREQAAAEAALREVVALADWQRAIAVFRAVTANIPGVS